MKAADEPAYLTVGTDVSAKYRGAFCEAKIKTVKRLVKVKVLLKQDNTTQLVQDDQVKGPLRVGAIVETRTSDGSFQEAIISKLTDASWYTVVFDDGDERTLRRTSLCLKGERHFAESETLDQLPLTNPEHFGTPVIAKKTNRGRRSSLPVTEDEKEEESSEDEDVDKRRLNDELLGKVVSVVSTTERPEWHPALVISPSCNDDVTVKKDQCLVRSFIDAKFYSVARKDIKEVDILNLPESELSTKPGLQKASVFLKTRIVPDNWKMDINEILESSSSDDEDGPAEENDEEKEKEAKKEEEEVLEEELDPEERDNFLQQLYKFMEDRGTPINKPPVLGYKDLNLFKLFRLVYHQGGCNNIDSGAVWKQIYMDLGIPILNSAASYNVKTAYRKYLYGFEEYCRSANIQFRTIHHHEPKVKVEKKDIEEPMEEALKVDQEMPLIEVKSEPEENIDTNSESEREETELKSPRGRRKIARDANSIKKETEEEKTEDKLKDDTENKDLEDDYETAEKRENELLLGRKNTPKQKEKKIKKQEDSEGDSDEEEEKSHEREESEIKCGSEGEDDDEDAEPCLTGTKVKVKYGRGKTQKIYEASIKSTEIDDGEILYLVHYYGWNVRYDEWVKADRIIWPLDKGGPKKKQKKKAKNKEDSEKDEKKDEERQKSKRGRPPLKSALSSNIPYSLSKTTNSEGKSDSFSSDSETEDPLEKNLINEELSLDIKEEIEKNDSLCDDKLDEEHPKIVHNLKENDRIQMQPLETMKLEVTENEQIVQIFGNKVEQEELKKEAEKSPKGKGRRSKAKDLSLEIIKISSFSQDDAGSEPHIEAHSLEFSSLESKNFSSATEDEIDQYGKEKKLKRKLIGQSSPEKKIRIENGTEMTNNVSQERTSDCLGSEGVNNLNFEQHFETENEGMPSLIAESNQCIQELTSEKLDSPAEEIVNTSLKEEEDAMPLIGPETLVCHEVDLDDLDEKDKTNMEDVVVESSELNSLVSIPPTLPPVVHNFSVASPLTLSQDESRSVKSESDITIEVDSIAEESQEGLCERESANGFEASIAPSTCSMIVQERESREKGQKRPSDGHSGLMAKKQKRTPKRTSAVTKNEKNGADELDNMTSTERISFLQEKLQEIRKYYMSLKSEVATIDRRRKRLKKKDREVSHAGASMSSASSDTGMSPSSSSPPQNVLAVECR
ncbi:AT-rich interactive domain-containing protein 4A isoform X2 [Dipodomys merriami]|uniref:AT-rich interactive domain-containing protein 4A isoform X2 n=1 Tax=Dipodomys merriami TaxID=94247 RepID=UPI00385114F8